MTTPAGWYDDGSGQQRWWDGHAWTEHLAPGHRQPEPEVSERTVVRAKVADLVSVESVRSPEGARTHCLQCLQPLSAASAFCGNCGTARTMQAPIASPPAASAAEPAGSKPIAVAAAVGVGALGFVGELATDLASELWEWIKAAVLAAIGLAITAGVYFAAGTTPAIVVGVVLFIAWTLTTGIMFF